jgi:hypothetical protein
LTRRKSDLEARQRLVTDQARQLASVRLQALHPSAFRRLFAEALEEVKSEFARTARERNPIPDAEAC